MKTSKKYAKELYNQFRYFATWLPSTPIALGDIGVFKNNQFTKISNLSDFGIQFEEEADESKANIEHSTKGSVSITTKAAGTVSPQGSTLGEVDAGFIVEFSNENSILFKANGTTSPSIRNQVDLGKQIINLYKAGKWDKDWAVITEVVKAESATILISSSSSGKIELKASGDIKAVKFDIADADLNLELSFSKDLSTKIIAEESLTPLFKVSKVKGKILSPPKFELEGIRSMDIITPDKAKNSENIIFFSQADYELDDE